MDNHSFFMLITRNKSPPWIQMQSKGYKWKLVGYHGHVHPNPRPKTLKSYGSDNALILNDLNVRSMYEPRVQQMLINFEKVLRQLHISYKWEC